MPLNLCRKLDVCSITLPAICAPEVSLSAQFPTRICCCKHFFLVSHPHSHSYLTEEFREQLEAIPPNQKDLSFGNDVYTIRFEDRDNGSVYGHKYTFFLKDAVENVPEYVVKWENFVQ